MGQEQNNLRSRILETLAYIELYAPDFPAEDQTTTQKEFSKLFDLLQSFYNLASGTDRRRWLDLALQESQNALRAFTELREDEATKQLQSAEEHFNNYLHNRKLRPSFLVSPDGVAKKE